MRIHGFAPCRRYYLEIVGRRRFHITRAWEQDGYRVADAEFFSDEAPEEGSTEAVQLAETSARVGELATQIADRLKCAINLLVMLVWTFWSCWWNGAWWHVSHSVTTNSTCNQHPRTVPLSPFEVMYSVRYLSVPFTSYIPYQVLNRCQ